MIRHRRLGVEFIQILEGLLRGTVLKDGGSEVTGGNKKRRRVQYFSAKPDLTLREEPT